MSGQLGQCSWCAWDCPSPEVALCAPEPEPPEPGLVKAPTVRPSTTNKWMTNLPDIALYNKEDHVEGEDSETG